jgi:hypothetical protein
MEEENKTTEAPNPNIEAESPKVDITTPPVDTSVPHVEVTSPHEEHHKEEHKTPNYILPPKKYRLKILLFISDLLAVVLYIYYLIIRSIIKDVSDKTFSFVSSRTISYYCVFVMTAAALIFLLIFRMTKSAKTRYARENELRIDPTIKVWLCGFNWGWPILFLPTMALMAAAGVIGLLVNLILGSSQTANTIQYVLGGIVLVFGTLNAAVAIFKIRPLILGLLLGGFVILLLVLLLHGTHTFAAFFKGFRHLGINIEPTGYILLAYVWSIFLRIIWINSLFYYWVFLPNRLELQHGLAESNDSVDRNDMRHQIDTEDVILRWWNIGIITFYFPDMEKLPITNIVYGINKKAVYANRIASVKTMQD